MRSKIFGKLSENKEDLAILDSLKEDFNNLRKEDYERTQKEIKQYKENLKLDRVKEVAKAFKTIADFFDEDFAKLYVSNTAK